MEFDHFSYSSVSLWHHCPRAWYVRYVKQELSPPSGAQIFGTAAHNAIESDILNKTSEAHLTFSKHLQDTFNDRAMGMMLTEDAYDKLEEEGKTILSDPMVQFIIEGIEATEVEKYIEFLVPGVPVPIIGYIDIVCTDGVPMDIKTSWNDWGHTRAEDETQPDFYLYAMDVLNIGERQHRGRFRHLIVVKRTDAPRAYVLETVRQNYVSTVDRLVQSMWAGIQRQDWKTPGFKCRNPRCNCHQHSW